jgi:hypothetical protein
VKISISDAGAFELVRRGGLWLVKISISDAGAFDLVRREILWLVKISSAMPVHLTLLAEAAYGL